MALRADRGGPATQAGIYFQNCVTVLRLAEMLCGGHLPVPSSGRIITVRTEAPEEVDDTVVVWSSGRTEYIQAKLSLNPGTTAWDSLWKSFYRQYERPDFSKTPEADVITLAVGWAPLTVELNNLLARAKTAETSEEWTNRLTEPQRRLLASIRGVLQLDDEALRQFCRFVQVWVLAFEGDPMQTDAFDVETCRKLQGVIQPTTNVFSVLVKLTGEKARIRGSWDYDGLIRHLEQVGQFEVLPIAGPLPPSEFLALHPNPYLVGPPLRSPTDLFVGRDGLVEGILWRLRKHSQDRMAPNAILLYGPHRSGKSSVLFQLKHRLGPEYRPIFVDLNGVCLAPELPNVLGGIADRIGTALLMMGGDVSIPPHDQFVRRPVKAMSTLMHEVVLACAPRKPVLMLDESDTLSVFTAEPEPVRDLLVFMRGLIEQSRDLFFILTSCRDVRWVADPGMSRLLTLAADCLRVDLLPESDTIKLIQDPVQDHFAYTNDALQEMIELSGCHPCFVQLMCRQVVDWRNQQGVNEISLEELQSIVPEAIDRGHGQFVDLWRGLTQDERVILCGLSYVLDDAKDTTPEAVQAHLEHLQLHTADWDLAINRLAHIGLLDLQEGHLHLQLGLVKHWVCRTPLPMLLPGCSSRVPTRRGS
jgi:hypothetical protein